jgi:FtsP/CotA-like multicopper oxidase with cupredoxin domain
MNQSVPFNLVATDAGYTAKPHSLENMPMAPGERAEWVVDFSGQQGQSFFLTNYPNALDPSAPGGPSFADPSCYLVISNIDTVTTKMLEIVVGPPTANPITTIPATFAPLDIPSVAGVDRQRTKNIWSYNTDPMAPPFSIDTINFDTAVINDTVRLNDIEIWTLTNFLGAPIPIGHPFHIHDVHFFVIEINGSTDIPAYLQGPKDVVFVPRGTTIKFVTQFLDFDTPLEPQYGYMYHCHILSHEDGGMMHQFVVVDPALLGTEGAGGQADPEWALYPNPSAGHVSLRGSCSLRSRLLLYDVTGRQAAAFSLPPFNREQPLPELALPPGIYQAQWVRPDGRSVRTLVIR